MVCVDGTNNEPERGATNVARTFRVAAKDARQLVYYDPGVGTLGARAAITAVGKAATRSAGLVAGYGIRDDIEQAYSWLSTNYQRGDRLFVFGFSRGAYTARALTGMLRTVGLLRPGSENLTPYALKLYARSGPSRRSAADPDGSPNRAAKEAERKFWAIRRDFREQFANPDFPHPFDTSTHQVHYLGVWDTVKSVGWLDLRGRLQVARWPFTARIANVGTARHAMAIDERRRFYQAYRFDPTLLAADPQRFQERWFAGVHSDVGGQFEDHRLSDIAFSWILHEAATAGLRVDERAYRHMVGADFGQPLPHSYSLGAVHPNEWPWWLLGGWRARTVLQGDVVDPSVLQRITASAGTDVPYRPALPDAVVDT
ncbi:DUF2235 domain-containing protein [Mycolicibacterium fortuitum]|uniref:DUF2235 domain-containing protein n=1 Tax=Mycolicibacterium fortuitum TaxID=1766 RepID=UPI001F29F6EF|nr:DUF2235 domain-containing protein [Mycolicibacterium fortuitum]